MRLPQNFYNQSTRQVAQQLLGKFIVSTINGKKIIGIITETEAYVGLNDKASHASRGKTPRNEIMFGEAGYWYVYLIYGMYYCLNIVTEHKNYPAAVLIRALTLLPERQGVKTDGPGKLCRALKINKTLNGQAAFGNKVRVWIEDRGLKIKPSQIKKSPRIGVDYAGEYKDKLWRFSITL
ncbi:MAG: DNA-3-methyladenine glycosylase [Patescibacteria group bacterium]